MISKIAVFLLLLCVVISNNEARAASADGDLVTILAIDGGGMKGIVPAVVLQRLELALQDRNPDARIAEYFDVVAGTSTGGIVTAILTFPDPLNKHRPRYAAQDIIKFYREDGPKIFSNASHCSTLCNSKICLHPIFDGKYLRELLGEKLNGTLLNQTTTNVVIPTFDIKLRRPTIFSTFKVEKNPELNVKLSDACIGTSAAPIVLPPYYFKNQNYEFNIADGALVADNPAMVALSEVLQQEKYKNKTILLLSLGTGLAKYEGRDANQNWGTLDWLQYVTGFEKDASMAMSEYYVTSIINARQDGQEIYLRIQDYDFDEKIDGNITDASNKTMDALEEIGNNLLKAPVKRLNLNTFDHEETGEGTYEQALDRLAEILSKEKVRRLGKNKASKVRKGLFPLSATY